MSSYIVDKETIDKIVTKCGQVDELRQLVIQEFGLDVAGPGDTTRFGRVLLALNHKATSYRYPDKEIDDALPITYTFTPYTCSLVEGYKAARCWLYQCDEGDFDKHPTFVKMGTVLAGWAEEIVEGLTDYEAAPWG